MARAANGEGSVYKSKDGRWRGSVSVNGKRKYVSAATKGEASKKVRALLLQKETGELVAGKTMTVAEWVQYWHTVTEDKHAASTHAGYRTHIERHIIPNIGKKRLDKLTIDDLDRFYKKMNDDGYSGATRRQVHSILRVALKHAVWRGHVGRNVAAMVEPPSVGRSEATALSDADVAAIYKALSEDRFRARWHLSLDFGLRPGEAIALEWKHIDFTAGTVKIEQQILQIRGKGAQLVQSTKTGAGARRIALPPYMMEMLAETRDQQLRDRAERPDWAGWEPDGKPHSFCFTRPDGSVLRPGYDTGLWKELLTRAGLPHTKRYASRHTAASAAIADGADIPAVAEMMGHSNPAVTLSIYTHAIEERKVQLAEQAAARFAARLK